MSDIPYDYDAEMEARLDAISEQRMADREADRNPYPEDRP